MEYLAYMYKIFVPLSKDIFIQFGLCESQFLEFYKNIAVFLTLGQFDSYNSYYSYFALLKRKYLQRIFSIQILIEKRKQFHGMKATFYQEIQQWEISFKNI